MEIKPWIYEHYKWRKYEVIGEAFSSENLWKFVVYKALYNSSDFWKNALWVRPKDDFLDFVEKDWKKIQRFRFISWSL